MKDTPPEGKPITAKRQKILAMAFEQLRKSRAKIDPGILQKIRKIVSSSPELMNKLGVGNEVKPDQDMPLSQKQKVVMTEEVSKPAFKKDVKPKDGYEEVDQAKNMEIMAKLMEINPASRDSIKAVIKKSGN